jgi:uncharacterized membrane protein
MWEYIWDFPMTLLAWIVFNLIILTGGKVKWLASLAIWLEISENDIEELLK